MELLSLYVGILVGMVAGMLITVLWIDRRPPKPEWFNRFEKDCEFTRPQAMGKSHEEESK